MRGNRWTLLYLLACIIPACSWAFEESPGEIRYGVIGDSYSIGEGASYESSWPAVLTRDLARRGIPVKLVANPARTGWTTQQAIDAELPVFTAARPTFATLQIGVNDLVQGVSSEEFRKRLDFLINAMQKVLPDKKRLILVTIPDFTITPFGKTYDVNGTGEKDLAESNDIIAQAAKSRGLAIVDILPQSRMMASDSTLIAGDGLHPSAREYAAWEKVIFPAAFDLLKGN